MTDVDNVMFVFLVEAQSDKAPRSRTCFPLHRGGFQLGLRARPKIIKTFDAEVIPAFRADKQKCPINFRLESPQPVEMI